LDREAVEEVLEEGEEDKEEKEDLDVLQTEVKKARAEAEEYLEQLQRSRAEFANYKKRNEREREDFIRLANAALITKLLPILDACERALSTVPESLRDLTWVEGIFLIERRLRMILEQEGLSQIDAVGEQFDPEVHHAAVREETSDYEDGEIIDELQKGYKLNDRVLRPAMVRIAAKPGEKRNDDTG
jgi:molecular chaperone GrpE